MNADLLLGLAAWDGRSAAEIEALARTHAPDPSYLNDLWTILRRCDPELERGATWLLKRAVEEGAQISARRSNRLWRLLPHCQHWESELHLLQLLPRLPVTESSREELARYLRSRLSSKRIFLRAWAFGGFAILGQRFPKEHAQEASRLVAKALNDEAPSVRARLRRVLEDC
jgi:hypothetical protein